MKNHQKQDELQQTGRLVSCRACELALAIKDGACKTVLMEKCSYFTFSLFYTSQNPQTQRNAADRVFPVLCHIAFAVVPPPVGTSSSVCTAKGNRYRRPRPARPTSKCAKKALKSIFYIRHHAKDTETTRLAEGCGRRGGFGTAAGPAGRDRASRLGRPDGSAVRLMRLVAGV